MEFAFEGPDGGFSFENRASGGGGGGRTMEDVEKTEVEGKDEADDDDDGPKKEKPREIIPVQWEVSAPDMPGGGGFDKENRPPFEQYEVKRGQKKGGGSSWLTMGASTPEKVVATLKVKCRAFRLGYPEANRPTLNDKHTNMGRDMRMHVRLYVIQGINLMPKDDNGFSDPFLNVELTNNPKIMDKARTIQYETIQPLFYVMYEFRDCTMPGDHTITIEVWDEDYLGDDLIGKASIDIEDRWYSANW